MISTVTTTTVTTVTTATVAVAAGLGFLAVLTLLAVLIPTEIINSASHPHLRKLGQALNVALIPLLLGFVLIAAVKILEAVR